MIQQIRFYAILLIVISLSCSESRQAKSPNKSQRAKIYRYGSGDVVMQGYLDQAGNLWFATSREGVFKYDGTQFTNYSIKDGLSSNDISAIMEDEEGSIWFATSDGVCRFDGRTFDQITLPQEDTLGVSPETGYPSRKTKAATAIIQDRNGDFWIGTNASGAYHFDGNTFTSFLKYKGRLQPDSVYNNFISSIIEDPNGDIWISSFTHGGINQYKDGKMIHHALKDGFGDGMISTGYMDKSGDLWFGTRNGGIFRYDGKGFKNIRDEQTGEQIMMASVFEDSKGTFWIASFARNGVFIYDGQSFLPFEVACSDELIDIKCIAEDKDGNIWFGGRYGLLWRYDGTELRDFTQEKRG